MNEERGFVLLLAIILLFLVSGMVATIYIDLIGNHVLIRDVEGQLYAQTLAENGIEYSQAILPYESLNPLLSGADGVISPSEPGWRNPISLKEARLFNPDQWEAASDDGFPLEFSRQLTSSGQGTVLVRFSNNPEEERGHDRDNVVVVRSMGIVPATAGGHPFRLEVKNHTSLVEARLRQERVFEAPSPLMLVGRSGKFEFSGSSFRINSHESAAVVCLSSNEDSQLESSLRLSLDGCRDVLDSPKPEIIDMTENYIQDARYHRLFSPTFWDHLRAEIPRFAASNTASQSEDSLVWTEGPIELQDHFQGILVSLGPLTLRDVEFDGLLIHLGDAKLALEGSTRVRGAIWVCDLALIEAASQGIHLDVRDNVEIFYNVDAINRVLPLLPATLLQWRILFPEMEG